MSTKKASFGAAGRRSASQQALAQEAARELLASLDAKAVICFADGACRGNPGPAGSGALVLLPDGRRVEASLALGRATNNIAELSAIGLVLDLLGEAAVAPDALVALLTDSTYGHGVLCRDWKPKKNQALISVLRARLAERPGLRIYWIAGHVGVHGNERADELANAGLSGCSERRWYRGGPGS